MQCFALTDECRINGRTGRPLKADTHEIVRKISLRCAKNEYASFQIVLETELSILDSVRFRISGTSPFDRVECKPYYEWYHAQEDLLIPDLLVPWDHAVEHPISQLASQHYQTRFHAFWIDLFVPEDMPEGVAPGTVFIASAEGEGEIEIELNVSRVSLCNASLLTADLNNYADGISNLFPSLANHPDRFEDGSYFAAERQFFRAAHEHRGLFHLLSYTHAGFNFKSFAPETEGQGTHIRVSDWSLYDEHFGPYFDGSAFADTHRGAIPVPFAYLPFCFDWPASYEKWEEPGFRIENRRILLEFIRHFEEKGWTQTALEIFYNHKKRYRFYPYDGDEVRHAEDEVLFAKLDDLFSDLLDLSDVRVILRTDSSWSFGKHYNSEFSKIVHLWVAGCGLFMFHRDSAKHLKMQGNTLFVYTGLAALAEDLAHLYEIPMRCIQSDVDGFTLWNTTGVGEAFLTCPRSFGRETLFYPAHPFGLERGVFPSLRLKYLRNAMQTADLVKMHEGAPVYDVMRAEINRLYGISQDDWFAPNPEALHIPPEEMTNALIAQARKDVCSPAAHAAPDLPGRIKARMLDLAEAFVPGRSIWA